MYEVSAHAIRHKDIIEVTVIGFLATSCHQAKIVDVYPGGKIMYVKDPGSAQVFIEESVQPGTIYCAMVLVPWIATTVIMDHGHKSVSIFINRHKELEVTIEEKSKAEFIVLQLTGGIVPNGDYSIVPASAIYPAIYTVVFGPDTFQNCDAWIQEHTKLPFQFLDGVALGYGGGGGNPHGLKIGGGGAQPLAVGGGGGAPHGLRALLEGGGSGCPRG